MELYYDDHDHHDFLEELMTLRRETLETNNNNNNHFFSNNTWNNNNSSNTFDCYYYDQNSLSFPPNSSSSYQEDLLLLPHDQSYFNEIYDDSLLFDEQSPPLIMDHHSSYTSSNLDTPPFLAQEDCYPPLSLMEEEEYNNYNNGLLLEEELQNLLEIQTPTTTTTKCKMEPLVIACDDSHQSPAAIFNTDSVIGKEIRKNRSTKKVLGQPSKNLMAERRRRKRLNDRLSMLRAIVPKISKMDRTSILGDTIDYMKELLEKINTLQEQQEVVKVEDSNMGGSIFKDVNRPNEILIRNSPKFEVERGVDNNTRVEICCAGKPGLLLSTINTMEALGLEIQQCVISCFNDFTMQVSCTEEMEQRAMVSSEDIKQALFRSAGYGGRCL